MKKIINLKNEDEIKEILYYYNQGINMGKEEMIVKFINNLYNHNISIEDISKFTNLSVKKILNYLK